MNTTTIEDTGAAAATNDGMLASLFSFPNPVNEVAARLVAGMVIALALAAIVTAEGWLIAVLAYEFLARVATGPTLSPMGLLATRDLVPWLGSPNRPTPGPPKRFAQAVGLVFSVTASDSIMGPAGPSALRSSLVYSSRSRSLSRY